MGVVTVLWALFGYSVAFAGGLTYALLHGVGSAPNETYAATMLPGINFNSRAAREGFIAVARGAAGRNAKGVDFL